MSGTDPLAGLPRPTGSPSGLAGLARNWTSGSQVLGRTSQVLIGMTGRVLAQSWSGQAAMACAGACVRDAALIAMTADSYEIAGNALSRYATTLAAAQAQWDKARRLADQAMADEQQHLQKALFGNGHGGGLAPLTAEASVSPLRGQATGMAQDAINQVKTAGNAAAGALTGTLKPFEPPAPKKPASHWYSPVTSFLGGAWDGIKDPAVMIGGLVGLHGSVTKNWEDLGAGLANGITHPAALGKALIDWQDLSSGNYSRWAGNLLPTIAATALSGGAAAGVKGADAVGLTAKSGEALEDLSDADKVAALSGGADLVPGMVGKDAGNALDYSKVYDRELANFSSIDHDGPLVLDQDTYLANVHNGSVALGAGRSLKYSTSIDDVLANSRGGFVDKVALPPQWGARSEVSIIKIPAGTEIHVAEGGTAPQVSHLTLPNVSGTGIDTKIPIGVKAGGGTQYLLKNVDRDWVVWTGKAPWPTNTAIGLRAAAGGATIRVPDALADVSQPQP